MMSSFVERFNRLSPEERHYILRHYPTHLAEGGEGKRLRHVLLNFEFMQVKVSILGPQSLIEDYKLSNEENLRLIQRVLQREAHILATDPAILPAHLHNMLYLFGAEDASVSSLLEHARAALVGRPWLRLTNRPEVYLGRSSLLRVLDQGKKQRINSLRWSPD